MRTGRSHGSKGSGSPRRAERDRELAGGSGVGRMAEDRNKKGIRKGAGIPGALSDAFLREGKIGQLTASVMHR